MFISSIIDRELRIALRKNGVVKSRFKTAATGVGVVCFFLVISWLTNSKPGTTLHRILFFGGIYYAVLPALRISVGLFSEERRNQTLPLLYLTGMGAGELFLGKLLGGLLVASCDLLALMPLLAIPFFSGGLSVDLFFATVACFPLLLLFAVSVGVLASVLCRDDGTAFICAALIAGGICLAAVAPYTIGKAIAGFAPYSVHWLCLSPAYAAFLVGTNFAGATPAIFWVTAGVMVLWTLFCLVFAAVWLGRHWRDSEVQTITTEGWRGRWMDLTRGTAQWRMKLRRRALAENAFQWLAEQDRRPVLVAWVVMGVVAAAWLVCRVRWPNYWGKAEGSFVPVFILLLVIDIIRIYATARAMGIARRQGSLELLLTTPLNPQQMFDGQVAALRSQFRRGQWAMLGLCLAMTLLGYFTHTWSAKAVISYLLVWSLFYLWCLAPSGRAVPTGMWTGLNTGRPIMVLLRRRKNQYQWWYYVFWIGNSGNLLRQLLLGNFPTGSNEELIVVAIITAVLGAVFASRRFKVVDEPIKTRLLTEMRIIARMPLPDFNDPQIRKWTIEEKPPMNVHVLTYPQRMAAKMGGALGRRWGYWRQRRRWR